MPAHPHAENMRLYAEDAAETDRPWERWELRCFGSLDSYAEWRQVSECSLLWHPCWEYRRKPKPLECWVNVHERATLRYPTRDEALRLAEPNSFGEVLRAAVHLREVTE